MKPGVVTRGRKSSACKLRAVTVLLAGAKGDGGDRVNPTPSGQAAAKNESSVAVRGSRQAVGGRVWKS